MHPLGGTCTYQDNPVHVCVCTQFVRACECDPFVRACVCDPFLRACVCDLFVFFSYIYLYARVGVNTTLALDCIS